MKGRERWPVIECGEGFTTCLSLKVYALGRQMEWANISEECNAVRGGKVSRVQSDKGISC